MRMILKCVESGLGECLQLVLSGSGFVPEQSGTSVKRQQKQLKEDVFELWSIYLSFINLVSWGQTNDIGAK